MTQARSPVAPVKSKSSSFRWVSLENIGNFLGGKKRQASSSPSDKERSPLSFAEDSALPPLLSKKKSSPSPLPSWEEDEDSSTPFIVPQTPAASRSLARQGGYLTQSEEENCRSSGIFLEQALRYRQAALALGLNIEIRAGKGLPGAEQMERRGEMVFARKPLSLKCKTVKGAASFAEGLILERTANPEEVQSFSKKGIFAKPHYLTLLKILSDPLRYELANIGSKEFKSGRLIFKSSEESPDVSYCIDLQDDQMEEVPSLAFRAPTPSKPVWWSELSKEIDFQKLIAYRFPVKYRLTDSGKDFQNDLVYAEQGEDSSLRLIIADNDLYAISCPSSALSTLDKSFTLKRIDCSPPRELESPLSQRTWATARSLSPSSSPQKPVTGVQDMLRQVLHLEEKLSGKLSSAATISQFTAEVRQHIIGSGQLTPFEFRVILGINQSITSDRMARPLQHGPETGNLRSPQPVSKTMIFTAEGEILLINSEQELVAWRLAQLNARQSPSDPCQFYSINENGNMKLWKDYVALQVLQDLPVSDLAKIKFLEYATPLICGKLSISPADSPAAAASAAQPPVDAPLLPVGDINIIQYAWIKVLSENFLSVGKPAFNLFSKKPQDTVVIEKTFYKLGHQLFDKLLAPLLWPHSTAEEAWQRVLRAKPKKESSLFLPRVSLLASKKPSSKSALTPPGAPSPGPSSPRYG